MKEELIKKLETLLREKPISEIVDEVQEIEDAYNRLIEEQEHQAVESAKEASEGEGSDAEATEDEAKAEEERAAKEAEQQKADGENKHLDGRFKELINIFHDRLDKYEQAKKDEEEQNLKAKREIIGKLRDLITEEQNIGQAINKLRHLQRQWKSIGNVPADQYRELQNDYSFEVERFNYTLSIYKDLKELDLHKNLEKKQELVGKMEKLLEETSIKRTEMYVKAYQEEWEEAGPVPQEEWEEVRDAFREATRKVYDKINKHYDELREQQEANLEKKKQLIKQAKEISELDLRSPKKWNSKTEEIKALQQEWRKIGRVPRKVNEEIWQEFRQACNKFFDRKRQYFKELKEERAKNKAIKEDLLKKVEEWKDSEDWKEATKTIINLQKEWKATGAADRKDEQRLWKAFREACDHFFERKKHFFETMDERHEANLKEKEKILEELKAFKPGNDKQANLEKLREFNQRWKAIGHIPRGKMDEINNAYRQLLDQKYDQLGLDKKDKAVAQYKSKVASMADSKGQSVEQLKKEKRILQDRLKKTKDLVSKYETNMSFFTVSGNGSPLLEQARKKIDKAKSDAQVLEEKIKVIDKTLRQSEKQGS